MIKKTTVLYVLLFGTGPALILIAVLIESKSLWLLIPGWFLTIGGIGTYLSDVAPKDSSFFTAFISLAFPTLFGFSFVIKSFGLLLAFAFSPSVDNFVAFVTCRSFMFLLIFYFAAASVSLHCRLSKAKEILKENELLWKFRSRCDENKGRDSFYDDNNIS